MKFSAIGTDYKYPTVVRHQGMSIVLALRKEDEVSNIYYRVLATDPVQPDDDKSWSDRKKMSFPDQIRPAGMSLVTVDLKTAERTADAPFQALSDGKHVYLFRQSTNGALYVDRFVFDPALKTLNPTWEARFQRSRKRDIPASRKDTLGARDMEGEPFFEPTTELTVVKGLQDGRFSVLLLPGRLPSQWRWQVFVANSEGEIDSFSIGRGEDGLFDMADVQRTCLKWADVGRRFQTGPAALLYMQQEEAQDEYGRPQRVKRGARVMLAAPVGSSRYALELDGVDDYVSLGNPGSLQIEGAITIEAWVKVQATDRRRDIVAHGTGGVSLRIQDGQYQIGVGDQCASYAIPQEDVGAWIHLAGAYDGNQKAWLLYRNGDEMRRERDPTGAATVEEDWMIGKSFAGQINNVRLWNVARSQDEILQDMHGPPAGDEIDPVGYWPFDEGSGDTVYDRASGNHGRLHVGYFLAFDGLDDHIALPAMNPDLANGFTVEAWVRYRSFQRWSRIIDFGNGPAQDNILLANNLQTNNLEFQVFRDEAQTQISAPGVLETNTWMHLAATVDGYGNAALYKNGQLLVTDTVDHVPRTVNRTQNYIGRSNWVPDGYFDGDMREVRVWNVARSPTEIQATMNQPLSGEEKDLMSYWSLDEGAGDTIHDRASGHHGQLCVGYALELDGLDDYVDVAGDAGPGIDHAITVEAWVKHLGGNGHIVNRGGGSESGYSLLIWGGQIQVELQDTHRPEKTIVDNPLPDDGAWHHLAFTWDIASTTVKTYLDGELQPNTGTFRGPIGVPSQPLNIGRNAVCGFPFHGAMGDVRLWNVARSQDEIQQDMHGPPAGDEPDLVGYWLFDEGAGETVRDRASGNHGQLRVGYAPDSHALVFDGMDDHVALPDMNPDLAAGFTVEAWVCYHRFQSWSRIIDFGNGPSQDNVLLANEAETNNLEFHVFRGEAQTRISAPGALEANTWMHLAATVDGDGNAALYKNGQRLVTGTVHVPDTLNRTQNYIGRSNWATDGYFDGSMQQVRVWNIARTPDEIQATMNQPLSGKERGLVGYWPLNEGRGETIQDDTSGDHDGQLFVGPGDNPNEKWGVGPIPADSPDEKWGEGPDNPNDKWREGREDPNDKWVAVPPIAILDFGVSRKGTLALIGDLKDRSKVTLAQQQMPPALSGDDDAALLPIPVVEADDSGAAPMRTIAVDKKGLTVSAGLLKFGYKFARTGDKPFLLDGADGLIHLYFRGDYGQFLVAQHDTLTARAKYIAPLDGTDEGPRLHFTARRPGTQMQGYEITIADPEPLEGHIRAVGDTCQVIIDSQTGISETWQNVPRRLESFLAVLNGTATNDANDPLAQEGELVLYDYGSNVQREGVPPDLASGEEPFGSTLFAVGADNLPEGGAKIEVGNGNAAEVEERPARDCAWIREPQGKALQFGEGDYVELLHDKLAVAGDLTLEAWVKMTDGAGSSDPLRLVNYHSEGPRFTLGLVKDKEGDGYKVFAASEDKAVQTDDAQVSPKGKPKEWTHLAAVYNATTALKLDGQGYVDCGNDVTLDMTEAVTVEAWVTPERKADERLQPEVVLSKWGAAEEEQSWRLYIDTDDKPCFETRDRQRKVIRVKANVPLAADRPYHLAGVFEGAPENVWALKLDGVDDYVEIDKGPNLKGVSFSVAFWAKRDCIGGDHCVVGQGSPAKNKGLIIGFRASNKFIFAFQQNDLETPAAYIDTEWHHWACTYDASTKERTIYRDGVQVAHDTSEERYKGSGKLTIGRPPWGAWFFPGLINNVRIWNRALSIKEIGEDMDKPTLEVEEEVGHWAFDQSDKQHVRSPGGKVQDLSDNGNHGTLRRGLTHESFIEVDKCRYEQKIWVDGDLQGWRWVTDDGKKPGQLDRRLTPSDTEIRLRIELGTEVNEGDCLLLQDEQVLVREVKPDGGYSYKLVVDRAVNGIAREHRRHTEVYFLKRGANEVAPTTARVNIGRSASDEGYFQGTIDDVRLWNVGRRDWQIRYCRDEALEIRDKAETEGLVGDWRFEEGRGKTAIDSKGSNHGRLVHPEADEIEHMWTPAARNAELTLYVNGRPVQISDQELGPDDFGGYGTTDQFTIGAMIGEDETPQQHMTGRIDEVRVWSEVRSPEQIRDNMYRALSGAEEGLAGYWPLDEGEGTAIGDQTGNGQDGILQGLQWKWIDSTAPIGNEGPEVRNVYDGLKKPGFNKRIVGPPAAVEYGDMQWDDEGNLFGVMKRCYIFQDDALQLVTGFKVGDLELNFIGQVQTAPTLIGYIEGAPPVPSENLTVNDPVTDDYVGTSTIELTEAKETIQVYSASRDTGFDMSVELKAGVHWDTEISVGFGVHKKALKTEGKAGVHTYFEHSLGWLSEASKTAGTSKTLTKSLTLGGSWEDAQDYDQDGQPRYLNPEVGRRYLPNNMGYALVKSGTGDLFALRLKRTGSLVAFQVLPNPDIPEDWNIIMFPLNPKYVKNGSLDGMVGLVADPDYPNASAGERGSYFKPLEAYALKEQIERETRQIEGYYATFEAGAEGRKGGTGTGEGGLLAELPGGELGYDWETGRDRRSMANTYVWTADGGFYAEEELFSSIRQESLGGSYHFLGQAGLFAEAQFATDVGFFFEVDALFGGHINVEVSKSEEERAAFGLHVDVQGEGFLNRWKGDPDKQQGDYKDELCPGKVDAYRFMTFYLAPKPQNFDQFFDEVEPIVDPDWLSGQGKYAGDEYGPNARALREARSKPNEVWRVLHRVTYVSRIPLPPEEGVPTPEETVPPDVRRPANIEANRGLIREIEKIKRRLPLIPDESHLMLLGRAVDRLLFGDASGDGQGRSELEEIVSWWADRDEDVKREIRQDLMTYLKAFYLSAEIEGGKQRVTEGLQVLYTFEEGEGGTVKDVSGVGALDLTVEEEAVRWIQEGGLIIEKPTLVANFDKDKATKLIQAAKDSHEITIEAWVRPKNTTQRGPARIVTLSANPKERNFTLGQDGAKYIVRLRTTKTDDNGLLHGKPPLSTPDAALTTQLTHVVFTRNKSGEARLYLNGEEVGNNEVGGKFSKWNAAYRFGLANEFANQDTRAWLGELYLVAIYSRALNPEEVSQNFKAGLD